MWKSIDQIDVDTFRKIQTAKRPSRDLIMHIRANKDNADLKKLAELWHDPEVLAAVDRDSRGTSVPVNRPAAELEEILERAEKDARENPDAE